MNTVFLGGSRRISRLNTEIRSRLDELVRQGAWIVVGDANGADRAMQQHLAKLDYERVVVYAIKDHLRNNLGHWQTCNVEPPKGARGFQLFSAKDLQMAQAATSGLMLWDGESRGTLANVRNLLAGGKPVTVYLGSQRRFVDLSSASDLRLLGQSSDLQAGEQQILPFFDRPRSAALMAQPSKRG